MAENSEIPSTKVKRTKVEMVLPAIVLATSFYYSLSFTGGIVAGYVLCKLFCHLFVHNGKVNYVFVDFGKWRLHLHHWIMGIVLLVIVWIVDHYYLPTLFAGFICGIIIQDIYDYNDWHQIIVKNPNKQVEEMV